MRARNLIGGKKKRWLVLLLVLAGTGMGLAAWGRQDNSPPLQPIPFSHRLHLENQIECATCHEGSLNAAKAGLPGVNLCMGCHETVAADRAPIQQLKKYAVLRAEIPWRGLPRFPKEAAVYFTHKRHSRAGIACETCHGNVAEGRVRLAGSANMGQCVECHRQNRAPTECLTCHY